MLFITKILFHIIVFTLLFQPFFLIIIQSRTPHFSPPILMELSSFDAFLHETEESAEKSVVLPCEARYWLNRLPLLRLSVCLLPSTWKCGPLIEVVGVGTRVEWEADNSANFLPVYQSQSGFGGGLSGFDRQRRKFALLSASHSTRVYPHHLNQRSKSLCRW